MTDEQTPAEQVTALLDELYQRVETREQVPQFRRVTRVRGDRRSTATFVEFRPHVVRAAGLLDQLATAAIPGGSAGWDDDGALAPIGAGGSPDPAEPVTDAWHVADETRAAIAGLWQQLAAEGHCGSLVDIALADEQRGRRIAARLRGLVQRARISASYDAPIVPLRDVCCPECGGELRVRTDASSAVWCAGTWTVEGPAQLGEPWPVRERCGAAWPRGSWVQLLDQAEPA